MTTALVPGSGGDLDLMGDRRTSPSTPERGSRAGEDAATRLQGATGHLAVDSLGYWLALGVTPAEEPAHHQMAALVTPVHDVTSESGAGVDPDDRGAPTAHPSPSPATQRRHPLSRHAGWGC